MYYSNDQNPSTDSHNLKPPHHFVKSSTTLTHLRITPQVIDEPCDTELDAVHSGEDGGGQECVKGLSDIKGRVL